MGLQRCLPAQPRQCQARGRLAGWQEPRDEGLRRRLADGQQRRLHAQQDEHGSDRRLHSRLGGKQQGTGELPGRGDQHAPS